MVLLGTDVLEFKNIIEFLALVEGEKSVVRLVINNQSYDKLREFCDRFNLKSVRSNFSLETVRQTNTCDTFQKRVDTDAQASGNVAFVIYIGILEKHLTRAKETDENDCEDVKAAEIFDYPRCCGLAYREIFKINKNWIDNFFSASPKFARYHMVTNRISSLIAPSLCLHYDYFPCGVGCEASEKIAKQNRSLIKKYGGKSFLHLVEDHLSSVIVIIDKLMWYCRIPNERREGVIYSGGQMAPAFSLSNEADVRQICGGSVSEIVLGRDHGEVAYNDKRLRTNTDQNLRLYIFQ